MHRVWRWLRMRSPGQLAGLATGGMLLIISAVESGWATTLGRIVGSCCLAVGVVYILGSAAAGIATVRDTRRG